MNQDAEDDVARGVVEAKALAVQKARDILAAKYRGVMLGPSISDTLMRSWEWITNVLDVEGTSGSDLAQVFAAQWRLENNCEAPDMMKTRIVKWGRLMDSLGETEEAGNVAEEEETLATRAARFLDHEAGQNRGAAVQIPPAQVGERTKAMYARGVNIAYPGMNEKTKSTAVGDCISQNLEAVQISALSGALEIGHVLESHEIAGENYAGDPRAYAVVKAATKYDDGTFSKLLAAGKLRELSGLVTDLARDYASSGHAQQAVLISSWWTETQVGFKGDDKALLLYLRAYRRSYAGRGFPTAWDERMAVRARNEARTTEGPTLSREDVAKIVRTETSALTQKNAALAEEIKRIGSRKPVKASQADDDEGKKVSRLKNAKCYKCGRKGHMARDCTETEVEDVTEE